jgi:hypothetical protein
MRQGFRKRGLTIFAASLWAFAALLQGFAPALSDLVPEPRTEVRARAIDKEGSFRQGICNHHPQGCPADCFCPKTGFVEDAISENPGPSGVPGALLAETSWAECSETRAAAAPAFAVYLAEPAREIPVAEASASLVLHDPAPARSVFRAPPAKVPIG